MTDTDAGPGGALLTLTPEQHRRQRKRYRRRTTLTAYAFLSPNLVAFAAFLLIPVVWLFVSTFRTGGVLGPAQFVGLDNWRETFSNPLVQTSIRNTVVYSAMAIPAVFVIAMVLALALHAIPRGGRRPGSRCMCRRFSRRWWLCSSSSLCSIPTSV